MFKRIFLLIFDRRDIMNAKLKGTCDENKEELLQVKNEISKIKVRLIFILVCL